MTLSKMYHPYEHEPSLAASWQVDGVYHYQPGAPEAVYSVDTPPPTVSGNLHLGHVYSYSHADFMARFMRMRGRNVFYPMGYDDNGLPTERLVEKRLGITAQQVGRSAFIQKCLEVSEEVERDYQALWQRLGLSIDWRYTYRTIDERSRRLAQWSFLDLLRKDLAYRREAPAIWCPECQTAIAQAEVDDLERDSEYVSLHFAFADGPTMGNPSLEIATTRPELLPACVAVFIHPEDGRYRHLVGKRLVVPLFGQVVPLLADTAADPGKGSGVVMCCTFGDAADVNWYHAHHLPYVEAIGKDGRMTGAANSSTAGTLAGLTLTEARQAIKSALEQAGLLAGRIPIRQVVRVHERCDTPVEYALTGQWFIRVLDYKDQLLDAGERVQWRPAQMQARYRAWVEGLNWDWCISRQRYFGVPFPLWTCAACGAINQADEDQLPVDPQTSQPRRACTCGSTEFIPDTDVMDTWATSSLTPQIIGGWLNPPNDRGETGESHALTSPDLRYTQVFPFSLRPQAHEIIRTWAFYTLVKSLHHFNTLPWENVLISGWGLAGEGMGKISKSRGGGPMEPLAMIERYSADAVRYWAASTAPGKDALISEEKIEQGARLVTKLWNVARFSERFLDGYSLPEAPPSDLTPADRWLMSSLQSTLRRTLELMEAYEYAAARNEAETFFWRCLADNYLEMAKARLYTEDHPQRHGAQYCLYTALLASLKLFAPFLPFVTETIYHGIFSTQVGAGQSIHRSPWPLPDYTLEDPQAEALGEYLVEIATTVRRYKSEHNLALSSSLNRLQLAAVDTQQAAGLQAARADLESITRARSIQITLEDQVSQSVPATFTGKTSTGRIIIER